MARLLMRVPYEKVGADHRDADYDAVRRGTVQHEVFEGQRAQAFFEGDELSLDIDCKVNAGVMPQGVRYGLVVSLEVAPGLLVDVHEEIRLALRTRARAGRVRIPGA